MPRTVTILALMGALALVLPGVAHAGPVAQASKSCKASSKPRALGPTYTTSLRVRSTRCGSGRRVVRAWYECRVRAGGRDGRCRSRVLGYRCSERRSNVIPSQFDAVVACKKGGRRVRHTYTQFT